MLRNLNTERRLAVALEPLQVLYGLYAARLFVALGVFVPALLITDFLASQGAASDHFAIHAVAIAGLAAAAVFTPLSYFLSHHRRRSTGRAFLLSQAILDVGLASAVVHITGGLQSPFVSLFIGLAAAYALLLPLAAALVIAVSAGLVHGTINLATAEAGANLPVLVVQVVIITLVAAATSVIGSRLRAVRSQLRTVEGELRRLELDTADVLRIIPSGVVTIDSGRRLVYANLAAAELLGIDVEASLGRDVAPLFERLSPELAIAVDETLHLGRRLRNRELEIVRPTDGDDADAGDGVPLAVSSSVLTASGKDRSYVLLMQDLRPGRQLEDLRLRAGRLGAVAELSASLAHELKNPLASIRSAAEQLCGRGFEDEDDGILGRLIVRESDRLNLILGEFGDFARVDVAERRPVPLDRLIPEVLETVGRHPAAAGRARLESEFLDDAGGLWGDPELLRRVLQNLVLNAVQVGEADGPVHVRVVTDSLRPDLVPGEISLGNPVRIRVIDDGPGIDPEDLPRIFDPFYTRRPGGSGLGLSIAHRAVQAHGGALLVNSEPGRGACFAVVLPRRGGRDRLPADEDRRVRELEALEAAGPGEG
ncbi:MAG: ATP-binding protein [Gemmatimonadota bacterium]|nr:ATP-binding protein [Gemmatimonadota bacterium]